MSEQVIRDEIEKIIGETKIEILEREQILDNLICVERNI